MASVIRFYENMEFTAFDLYAVFGDVVPHANWIFAKVCIPHALFSAVLAVIFGVYIVART